MSKWYQEAIFYHIYPLGLTGAPKENKEGIISHRLKDLFPWILHIKNMGCTAIYIGPLFQSATHGYDTSDYKRIDQRLGENEDFKEFVSLAHEQNIKVVVDGVFNHTGREFFAFQDIKENKQNSRYINWYKGICFDWNSPYDDGFGYEAWRNCFELVNLNLQEQEVKDYLFEIIKEWIREFDIDGIRLDCADSLDFDFMREMRGITSREKADFWLMGEVIHGDYARWVNDDMLHSVTNYELHKGLYSGHNDQNYFEIAHTVKRQFDDRSGLYKDKNLYSFVENHDVNRIMSKLKNKRHIFSVYTLLFTLPGIPSLYYGAEFGIEGEKKGPSDDELRPYLNLDELQNREADSQLLNHIKLLTKVKRENPVLSEGSYKELALSNRQYAFARISGEKAVIIAVNNDENPAELCIPSFLDIKRCKDVMTGEDISIKDGKIIIRMEEYGNKILNIN